MDGESINGERATEDNVLAATFVASVPRDTFNEGRHQEDINSTSDDIVPR